MAKPNGLYSKMMMAPIDIITNQVGTGWLSFFSRTPDQTKDCRTVREVHMEVRKRTKSMAPMIKRGAESRKFGDAVPVITNGKWSGVTRRFPWIYTEGAIDFDSLVERGFNRGEFEIVSDQEKLRDEAFRIHQDFVIGIAQTMELSACQALTTGKMDFTIGDTTDQLDFFRDTQLTFSPANAWTIAAGDPRLDIQTGFRRVSTIGGRDIDVVVMGMAAYEAFRKNTKILADIDKNYISWVDVTNGTAPAYLDFLLKHRGWHFQGYIKIDDGPRLPIVTSTETYIDLTGARKLYLATNDVFLACTGARMERWHGPKAGWPMNSIQRSLYREYFGIDPQGIIPSDALNGQQWSSQIFPEEAFFHGALFLDNQDPVLYSGAAPVYAPLETDAHCLIKAVCP